MGVIEVNINKVIDIIIKLFSINIYLGVCNNICLFYFFDLYMNSICVYSKVFSKFCICCLGIFY